MIIVLEINIVFLILLLIFLNCFKLIIDISVCRGFVDLVNFYLCILLLFFYND